MSIPSSVSRDLQKRFGISIQNGKSLSGGSINRAFRVDSGNTFLFLKYNDGVPGDFFEKEADGLKRLRRGADGLRVPELIATAPCGNHTPGYLLLEFIEPVRSGNAFQFGAALARLHQNQAEEFGLAHNNYIGSLPQQNRQHTEWVSFFSEERISPQLKMAVNAGKLPGKIQTNWNRLANQLKNIMPETKPSLLHGDLWSGNYIFDHHGKGVLIDPAVYYGHPEMDLAFTKMFGGFPEEFYRGYESVASPEPGFGDRVEIYNLYPLLVHVNLFGGHYTSRAIHILRQF